MDEIELTGTILLERIAEGSKSEHNAVFLDTGSEKYRIRMQGGDSFNDESLNKLIGKRIKATGIITPYFFEILNKPEQL